MANTLSPEAMNALMSALVGYQSGSPLVGSATPDTNAPPAMNSLAGPFPGGMNANPGPAGDNLGFGEKNPSTIGEFFSDVGDAFGTGLSMTLGGVAAPVNMGFAMANNHAPSTTASIRDFVNGLGFGGSAPDTIGADEGNKEHAAGNGPTGGMVEAPDGSKGQETYAGGGFTGGDVGQPAGIVHGQEFVLSAPAVAAIGVPFLTALNDHARAMMDMRNPADRMRAMQAFGANGLGRG